MVNSQRLFREYILWRSRMAVYAAFVLAILLVGGLVALLVSSPLNINRFGVLLQLLGVLALAPDIIGKDKFRRQYGVGPVVVPLTGPQADADPPDPEAEPMRDEAFFDFYQTRNLTFVLGNILASLALVWLLIDKVLVPRAELFPGESVWRVLFSLFGFAWLNFFMLLQLSRLVRGGVPRGLLAWFFSVDLFVGVLGVLFAGFIHILLRWVYGGLGFIFQNGMRRVLLIVTLPFFVAGLFFELIATFL